MPRPSRRRLLQAGCAIPLGAFAGCLATAGGSGDSTPKDPDETTDDAPSLADWERSTDCDRMHDSVVRVERVTASPADEHVSIRFADLSPGEKDVLGTVTRDGGYGTCDTSDAFHRFVERIGDRRDRRDTDSMRVYLERNGTYYGLYVEHADQVYAY